MEKLTVTDEQFGSQLSTNALFNKPEFKIVTINPEIAQDILENRNAFNRKIKKNQVLYMADLMERGTFNPYNGETLKFAGSFETGKLLDGQHRLYAIIESGKTYDFPVAVNIDESLFTTIDRGIPRSNGDMFEIEKVQNSRNIASMISTYVKLQFRARETNKSISTDNPLTKFNVSVNELLGIYRQHEELVNEIYLDTYALYTKNFPILGPSRLAGMIMWTVLHSEFSSICREDFWTPLLSGDNLEGKPNVKTCRTLLFNTELKKKNKSDSTNTYIAWIIKSYNNHFNGRIISQQALKHPGKAGKSIALK